MSIRRPTSSTPRGSSQPSRSLDDVLRVGMNRLTVSAIGMPFNTPPMKRPGSSPSNIDPNPVKTRNVMTKDDPMEEGGEQDQTEPPSEVSPSPSPSPSKSFTSGSNVCVPILLRSDLTKQGFTDQMQGIELAMKEHYANLCTWTQPHDVYLYGITFVSSTLKFLDLLGYKNEKDIPPINGDEDVDFYKVVDLFLELHPHVEDDNDDGETSVPKNGTPPPSQMEVASVTMSIGMQAGQDMEEEEDSDPLPLTETFELNSFVTKLVPFYENIVELKKTMLDPNKSWGDVLEVLWKAVCNNALLIVSLIVSFAAPVGGVVSDTIRDLNKAAKRLQEANARKRYSEFVSFVNLVSKLVVKDAGFSDVFGFVNENYRMAYDVIQSTEPGSFQHNTMIAENMLEEVLDKGWGADLDDYENKPYLDTSGVVESGLKVLWGVSYVMNAETKILMSLAGILLDASSKCLHENREIMRVFLKRNNLKELKNKIKGQTVVVDGDRISVPGIWQLALKNRFLPMKPNKPMSLRYNKNIDGGKFVKEPIPPRRGGRYVQGTYEYARRRYCLAKQAYDEQEQKVYEYNKKYRDAKNFYDEQWKEFQAELDALAVKLKQTFCEYADMHKKLGTIFKVPTREERSRRSTFVGQIARVVFRNPLNSGFRKFVNTLELAVRGSKTREINRYRKNIAEIFDMLKKKEVEYSDEAIGDRIELQTLEKELNKFGTLNGGDTGYLKAMYYPVPLPPQQGRGGGGRGAANNDGDANNPNLQKMAAYEEKWDYENPRKHPVYKRRHLVLNVRECNETPKKKPVRRRATVAPQAGNNDGDICDPMPEPEDRIADFFKLLTIDDDNGGYEFEEDNTNDMWSEEGDFYKDDEFGDDDEDDGAGVGFGR